MSLLSDLKERLSDTSVRSFKIGKKLTTLIISAAMVIAPISMAACSKKPTTTPGTEITNPDSPTNPDTPNQPSTNPLEKYSPVLQTVLTSDYYNTLIDESMKQNSAIFFRDAHFRAIPYAFLQQHGHDVEAIKNGSLNCETDLYFKGKNRSTCYLSVKVENPGDYITDYVLKYDLSDKESADLQMLYSGDYIQANLFVQELANQKTATIQSQVSFTNTAYEAAKTGFNNSFFQKAFNTKSIISFDIVSLNDKREIVAELRTSSANETVTCYLKTVNGRFSIDCGYGISGSIYTFNRISLSRANTEEFQNKSDEIYCCGIPVDYSTTILREPELSL